jgi:hypothetical protein
LPTWERCDIGFFKNRKFWLNLFFAFLSITTGKSSAEEKSKHKESM